jgi:hypothetical protein
MSDPHALMDKVARDYSPSSDGWNGLLSTVDRRRRTRRAAVIVSTLIVSCGMVATLVVAFKGNGSAGSTHAASTGAPLPHNLILNSRNTYDDGTEDGTRGSIQCMSPSSRSTVQQIGVVGKITSGVSPFAGFGQKVPDMFAHVEQSGPGLAVFALKSEGPANWTAPSQMFFTSLWVQSDKGCLVFYRTTSSI